MFGEQVMNLKVNGYDRQFKGTTVAELLDELRVMPARVAVEVNMNIVKKAEHGEFRLSEGDVVEIVNFVGGG